MVLARHERIKIDDAYERNITSLHKCHLHAFLRWNVLELVFQIDIKNDTY